MKLQQKLKPGSLRARRTLGTVASIVLFASLAGCGVLAADQETLIPLSAEDVPTQTATGVTFVPEDQRGEPISISGEDLSGNSIDTALMRGTPIVVNFWATWCEPCKEELPEFAHVASRMVGTGVTFLGVNVEDDAKAAIALSETLPYPSIRDSSGEILKTIPDVPPSALPITVILDEQGRIAVRVIGPVPPGTLESTIRQGLGASY